MSDLGLSRKLDKLISVLERIAKEQAKTNVALVQLLKYEEEDGLAPENEGNSHLGAERGRVIRRTP